MTSFFFSPPGGARELKLRTLNQNRKIHRTVVTDIFPKKKITLNSCFAFADALQIDIYN